MLQARLVFNKMIPNRNTLLVLLLLLFAKAQCDVIPENSHYVNRCAKIINADAFEDYAILGFVLYPTGTHVETYIVKPNDCLKLGYKFDILYILAVKKDYLATKNLDTTNWLQDKKVLKANIRIAAGGYYTGNDDPVSGVEEHYMITGFTDTSVIIYKSKETLRYLDGTPASIKEFKYNNTGPNVLIRQPNTTINSGFNTGMQDFLEALTLTVLAEVLILILLFKTRFKALNISIKFLLLAGTLPSLITLPCLWYVLPMFMKPGWSYMLLGEALVIILEAFMISLLLNINRNKAFFVSAVCNLVSFLAGVAVTFIK